MFLSNVSIARPVFALVLNLALIVFGMMSYRKLGVDQYPNVDFPVVVVQTIYPGADPKSVEEKVLKPLERGLSGLAGLDRLSATAFPNLGQMVLQFKLERNGQEAAQDVRDKVSILQAQFPDEVEAPIISKFDVGSAPILTLSLASNAIPFSELSRLAKDTVKPALEQVPGVGNMEVVGTREREIQILLNRQKLQSFGLSPLQVSQAVQTQAVDIPSGKVENSERLIRIRTESPLTSASDVSGVLISLRSGQKIRVGDVADVVDTLEDEEGFATRNGSTSIVLVIYKQSGGNTVAVANGVREKIQELTTQMPEGVELAVTNDDSIYIKGSLDAVEFDLVLGAILAIVIVMFFLRDWRATLISAVAIPTSVIATFAFMSYMGFTLNMLTTLALTLSIGILVDDAIVVIENIYRRIELGEAPMEAARKGTAEIGLAAMAITLSIVAVFVPVAFMEGIMGRFFYQFGLTVAFAVLVSLFVAFTLTPMMSSKLLKSGIHEHLPFPKLEHMFERWETAYRKGLGWALNRRWRVIAIGFSMLVLSIFLLRFVPMSFFPREDRSQFNVTYELPEGSSLQLMKEKAAVMDAYLRKLPGVTSVVMSIGANAEKKPNLARFDIRIVPISERTFSQQEMITELRTTLSSKFTGNGEKIELGEAGGAGGGRQQPIQFILRGNDSDELSKYANQMKEFLATQVPGAVDVTTSEPPRVDEIKVVPDFGRAADLGVNAAQVGQTLRTMFEGVKVGEFEDKGEKYDVTLKVDKKDARSDQDLAGITVPNQAGNPVLITSVATITKGEAPSKVERMSGMRQITVLANYNGSDLGAATNLLEQEAKRILPSSIVASFEGQAKMMRDSVVSILNALVLAILLVYLVLCAQFESFTTPFIIMLSVPLAFSGAFLGLLVTQKAMSIFAMIGLILLVGLVTKNAILLVDFTNQRLREGMPLRDALLEAGQTRLRPILMTTIAMIAGMLPPAFGHGVGGESRSPMAICVIGGLVSSTVLTLFVIPCAYSLLRDLLNFIRRKIGLKPISDKVVVHEEEALSSVGT